MSLKQISVVIIAKNAEETIAKCLDALVRFDEVLLYLNDSSDNTQKIASGYSNVSVVQGGFLGFGETKNAAAVHAKHGWILSLDSDEVLSDRGIDEIENLDLNKENIIYQLKRDNYFLGYKTQSQDKIERIYHKQFTHFNNNKVHEKIIIPSSAKVIRLKQSFKHLNITDINQTLTKIIHYTDLSSKEKKMCSFSVVIAKALFGFFKTYFIHGNILKGWVGFALAVNSANKRYYKYIKQFINCQQEREKSV